MFVTGNILISVEIKLRWNVYLDVWFVKISIRIDEQNTYEPIP